MVSSTAVTADLTRLSQRLRQAHQGIADTSEKLLDETSKSILELMHQFVPVDKGHLKSRLRIVSAPGMRTIGPQDVDYAAFQEWGTGIRGEFPTQAYVIRPRKPGGKLHFTIDGQHISTSEVHHPGIPPNPFVRPAAHQGLDNLESRYAQAGAELITRGSRG